MAGCSMNSARCGCKSTRNICTATAIPRLVSMCLLVCFTAPSVGRAAADPCLLHQVGSSGAAPPPAPAWRCMSLARSIVTSAATWWGAWPAGPRSRASRGCRLVRVRDRLQHQRALGLQVVVGARQLRAAICHSVVGRRPACRYQMPSDTDWSGMPSHRHELPATRFPVQASGVRHNSLQWLQRYGSRQ